MPLYTYKCPVCADEKEAYYHRDGDPPRCYKCEASEEGTDPVFMVKVLSTPSPMQWGCPKGF